MAAWAIFWVALLALAVFDFRCLAPQRGLDGRVPPTTKAHLHCIFWFCVGAGCAAGGQLARVPPRVGSASRSACQEL